MTWALVAIVVFVVAGTAAVRLAPSDPKVWHVDPAQAADPGAGGVLVRHKIDGEAPLQRFDDAMMTEPRVTKLAGSVKERRITYVARSQWVGFPDYITVSYAKGELVILSRLRFGQSDLGVNAARLERVLERL